MPKHALLSASASHRWLNCPPSAKLCADIKDEASPYAKQGADAHSLCEFKVLTALGQHPPDPTDDLDYFDQEMAYCTDEYCSYVMEQLTEASTSTVFLQDFMSFIYNNTIKRKRRIFLKYS